VIDIQNLTAFNPALAANVRYNLPAWISESERRICVFNAIGGLILCCVNLAAIVVGSIFAKQVVSDDPILDETARSLPDRSS
jgi:hypothetical protein